jgi:hypothetical protein
LRSSWRTRLRIIQGVPCRAHLPASSYGTTAYVRPALLSAFSLLALLLHPFLLSSEYCCDELLLVNSRVRALNWCPSSLFLPPSVAYIHSCYLQSVARVQQNGSLVMISLSLSPSLPQWPSFMRCVVRCCEVLHCVPLALRFLRRIHPSLMKRGGHHFFG